MKSYRIGKASRQASLSIKLLVFALPNWRGKKSDSGLMSRNMERVTEEKFHAIFCPLFQRAPWHFICTNSILACFLIIFLKVSSFIPLVRQQGVYMSDCHLTGIRAPKKPSTYLEYGTNQMCLQDFVFHMLRSLSPHSCQFGS